MLESLIDTWWINHRVTLKLLDALSEDELKATLSTRGGRDVARQLAHVHEVRANHAWLPPHTPGPSIPHFEKGASPPKDRLRDALDASAEGIEVLIRDSWEHDGRVSGFQRGLLPFVGYLIAHESHHRGSILLTLKKAGHPLSDGLKWGLWEWNKI